MDIIAELCQNHLGKFENIKKMTERCAENGAKVIKLQFIYTKNLTYRPEFENGIKIKNKPIGSVYITIILIFWFTKIVTKIIRGIWCKKSKKLKSKHDSFI